MVSSTWLEVLSCQWDNSLTQLNAQNVSGIHTHTPVHIVYVVDLCNPVYMTGFLCEVTHSLGLLRLVFRQQVYY